MTERDLNLLENNLSVAQGGLTPGQRVAICFAAGVIGALAVVAFSHILFQLGLSAKLGVKAPVSLKSPDIYKPLFWGGLWGIPFGLLAPAIWDRLYVFGLLYFLGWTLLTGVQLYLHHRTNTATEVHPEAALTP